MHSPPNSAPLSSSQLARLRMAAVVVVAAAVCLSLLVGFLPAIIISPDNLGQRFTWTRVVLGLSRFAAFAR